MVLSMVTMLMPLKMQTTSIIMTESPLLLTPLSFTPAMQANGASLAAPQMAMNVPASRACFGSSWNPEPANEIEKKINDD